VTIREEIMSSKRYPDEFKMEAVKQVIDRGHSVAIVAGRLGMTTHSLYAWIKKYGPDSVEHGAKTDDQAEILWLKKELNRTTEERDLLKKAAVYFANQRE
jgi:transposase